METFTCAKCKVEQPSDQFYFFRSRRRDGNKGRYPYCKGCHRVNNAKRMPQHRAKMYGLTQEGYDQLLAEQHGVCAICGDPPSGRNRSLSVDHDHSTGVIRGLLCQRHNLALGLLGDSVEGIKRALEYLKP